MAREWLWEGGKVRERGSHKRIRGKRINGDMVVALQLKKEWVRWGRLQTNQEWLMEEISERVLGAEGT